MTELEPLPSLELSYSSENALELWNESLRLCGFVKK